ncbi:hypothetical protein PO909_013075 [Leuciscus waleckii]
MAKGSTEDKETTSGTDSAGTGRLECSEAGGQDAASLGMPTACTDISSVSSTLDASLTRIGITLMVFMMTRNSGVASMTAEDSAIVSVAAGDSDVAAILAEDSGVEVATNTGLATLSVGHAGSHCRSSSVDTGACCLLPLPPKKFRGSVFLDLPYCERGTRKQKGIVQKFHERPSRTITDKFISKWAVISTLYSECTNQVKHH